MIKDLKYIFLVIFITLNAFSQENTTKHIVAKGESIYQIAKKYNVKQADIFKLNPNAKNTLKLNSVLLIPKSSSDLSDNTLPITHEVLPKQTLYGISKQYKVSIEDIKNANPIIEKEGLEIGLKLIIPIKGYKPKNSITESKKQFEPEKAVVVSNDEEITHLVLPKETKYGISKRYKMSISDLEKLNPEIVHDLPVGYILLIKEGIKKEVVVFQDPKINESNTKEEVIEEAEEVIEESNQGSSQIKIIEMIPHKDDENTTAKPLSAESMTKAELLIAKASENIGTRYRSGGTSKDGFDCSGLMINTFSTYDIKLPRSSNEMSRFGTTVDLADAQKGDLIFYTTNGRGTVNHVGMITEIIDDEIKFIHSSVHAGVIISSSKEPYYSKRFVKINRVLN